MSSETKKVFNFLQDTFSQGKLLQTIIQPFKCCSVDINTGKPLVGSQIKCINFDHLTKWFYRTSPPHSADSLTFAGNVIYLIEFKAGDQVRDEPKREKLIAGVSQKINDSAETLNKNVFTKIPGFQKSKAKLRFYLVVDDTKMGITPIAEVMASLASPAAATNPSLKLLIDNVLPNLKKNIANEEYYEKIDIWYSSTFDSELQRYHIVDVEKTFIETLK